MLKAAAALSIVFLAVLLITPAVLSQYDSQDQEVSQISSSLSQTMAGEEAESHEQMQEMEVMSDGNAGPRGLLDED